MVFISKQSCFIQQFSLRIVTGACPCTAAIAAPTVRAVASRRHQRVLAVNAARSACCTRIIEKDSGWLNWKSMWQEAAIEEQMVSWGVFVGITRG